MLCLAANLCLIRSILRCQGADSKIGNTELRGHMEANAYSKYALKDLHQAIELIDRKMNHCRTFESFDSQEDRDSTLRKLTTKRAALVKSALALTAMGVRSDTHSATLSLVEPLQDGGESMAAETETRKIVRPRAQTKNKEVVRGTTKQRHLREEAEGAGAPGKAAGQIATQAAEKN